MKRELDIWVFGDYRHASQIRLTRQVIGQARHLGQKGGRVTVLLLGHPLEKIGEEFSRYGAQRLILVDHRELALYRIDLFTSVICQLLREEQPDLLLLGASEFGTELAARISKRLGVGLSAECIALEWDEERERLIASCPAFGGHYLARISWSSSRPYMATLSPGNLADSTDDPSPPGDVIRIIKRLDPGRSKIKVISSEYEPHQAARLEKARVVVAGGRGVKNLQGFHYVRELASLLGGEVGATRPVVDAHWTSHDHLIGQTGKAIQPELLITCGTSGAIQYTAGIRGAGTVVAINRDPRAPIFQIADIGIVTDTHSFLPALLSEMKTFLFKEITELYRGEGQSVPQKRTTTFGQRVKKLREDQKMSLTELAEKTGQTPEFIEQVESDRLIPPVSFLLQLSHVLQIDPSNFLTEQEKVQIDGKRQEAFIKRTQNYSYRTLTPGAADKHLRAFMVSIEPWETHKMVEYKHPGEEFIFVYKGELEVTLGGKVLHLKQGETIHFDSETKHKLRNLSNERCELLVTLYTP